MFTINKLTDTKKMTIRQTIILTAVFALGLLCAFFIKYCGAEEPAAPEQQSFWMRIVPDSIKDKLKISQQMSEQVKRERAFLERCKAVNPELAKDEKVLAFIKIMEQEKTKDYYKELTGSNEVPSILSEPGKYKSSPTPARDWLKDKPIRRMLRDFTQPVNVP